MDPLISWLWYSRVEVKKSVGVKLSGNNVLHSTPLPGSRDVLAFILNILKHFKLSPQDNVPLLSHRMAEAFKWAYAKRANLGDATDPDITEEVNQVPVRYISSIFHTTNSIDCLGCC